ncbi:MAG: hypothetical protein ACK559_31060, partial [bacterium]
MRPSPGRLGLRDERVRRGFGGVGRVQEAPLRLGEGRRHLQQQRRCWAISRQRVGGVGAPAAAAGGLQLSAQHVVRPVHEVSRARDRGDALGKARAGPLQG